MRHTLTLITLSLTLLAGCGSTLGAFAAAGTFASSAIVSTAPLVPAACDHQLEACTEGDTQCVADVGAQCREAAQAFEATTMATRLYVDAVQLAAMAQDDRVLPALLTGLRSLQVSWSALAQILARHGVTLPTLDVAALIGGGT